MTIGPEPISRIFLMSSRRGMAVFSSAFCTAPSGGPSSTADEDALPQNRSHRLTSLETNYAVPGSGSLMRRCDGRRQSCNGRNCVEGLEGYASDPAMGERVRWPPKVRQT